jgi:putative transposase
LESLQPCPSLDSQQRRNESLARPLRFAPAGVALHVRSRGNQRQDVFVDEADRRRYSELLVQHCREHGVAILGFCQMTNHVHLILQPSTDDGLSRTMQRLNSEHAQGVQFRLGRCGHLWQGRFKATPMDEAYLWTALRYVELNPVRAGMVTRAEDWKWSSASAHLGVEHWPEWLEGRAWSERFSSARWRELLDERLGLDVEAHIRRTTRENRPLASKETIRRWETDYGVELSPGPRGRPKAKQPGKVGAAMLMTASGS